MMKYFTHTNWKILILIIFCSAVLSSNILKAQCLNYIANGSMETITNCPNLSGRGTIDYATGWSTTGGIASTGGQLMVNKPGICVSNRPSDPWPASSALRGGSDGTNWLGGHVGEDWQNKLQAPLPVGTYTFSLDAGNVIFTPWVSTSTTLAFYGLKPGDANFSRVPSQLIGSVVVNNVLSASNQTWVTRSFTVTTTQI